VSDVTLALIFRPRSAIEVLLREVGSRLAQAQGAA
jgi:hypothetical protein